MLKRENMLDWGARYRYPQLVLAPNDALKAGEKSWRAFVASATNHRRQLARKRIACWDELVSRTA